MPIPIQPINFKFLFLNNKKRAKNIPKIQNQILCKGYIPKLQLLPTLLQADSKKEILPTSLK